MSEIKPKSFSDLSKRVSSALVLIAVCLIIGFVATVFCPGKFLLVALVAAVVSICAWEFAVICGSSQTYSQVRVGYFALSAFAPIITAAFVAQALFRSPICGLQIELLAAIAIALVCFVLSFIGAVFLIVAQGRNDLTEATNCSSELPLGLLLIGLCGALIVALCGHPSSPLILLWLLLVVCINDSCAYFVGSKVGGPKLASAISPKKTYSGSIGGFIGGVVAGFSGLYLLPSETGLVQVTILSFALVAAAQLGDLAKSYLKRIHNVKDSGSIIPGHGGLLDRVDGILTAGALLSAWLCARAYLLS